MVGLPEKHGKPHPLYDYQQVFFETLFSQEGTPKDKHIWLLKAGGLGISELVIRIMCWLAVRDDYYHGAQMAIITGPNIDLAIGIIRRLKGLFPDHEFETKETLAIVNRVDISAYPSHNLDAMRSLTRMVFVLLDEADFFYSNEHSDARANSERYIPKSDPYLVAVSTPNMPGGLMQTIQNEPDALCIYHKLFFPYTVGLGKIYTHEEIERARASPAFEHEYNLQYGHGVGNIFPYDLLVDAIDDFDLTLRDGFKVLAVDPAFGGSKFAIVGAEFRQGVVHITDAMQFDRPSPVEMTNLLIGMAPKYNKNLVIDAAHPGLILDLQRAGINAEGVPFAKMLSEMTQGAAMAVKERRVKIHKSFDGLITQLRSVRYDQRGHPDKKQGMTLDLTDAFLMAVYYASVGDVAYCAMPND